MLIKGHCRIVQEHKRGFGHLGQMDFADLIEKCPCYSYQPTPRADGGGEGAAK